MCSPYANVPSNNANMRNDDGFFEKYNSFLSVPTQRFLSKYYTKDVYYVEIPYGT